MKKFLIAFLSLTLVLAFYGFALAAGGTSPEPGPGCNKEDLTSFPWTSGPFLKGTFTVAHDKDPASVIGSGGWGYQVHILVYEEKKPHESKLYSFPMPFQNPGGTEPIGGLCSASADQWKTDLIGVPCKFNVGVDFGYGDVYDKKDKQQLNPIGVYVPVLYDLVIGERSFCDLPITNKEMIGGTLTIRLVPYIFP